MVCASQLEKLVYLIFADDAGSSGDNLQDKCAPFQVVCAIVMDDRSFATSENTMGVFARLGHAYDLQIAPNFEFHAHQLFRGRGTFAQWPSEQRLTIFRDCMSLLEAFGVPIIYGAVNKAKLRVEAYRSANPLDTSFRLCAQGIEEWFTRHAPHSLGLLILDECDDETKHRLKKSFRELRRRSFVDSKESEPNLSHLIDDIYFGNSADSIGIQLADMCGFLIARHLAGKQDSEHLYRIIASRIHGEVFPK